MKSSVFRELRSFLLLWGSQAVSELGTAMTDYALILWAYRQTGTASSVTLLTISAFLPTILFRFFAGTLADRWNKKRIMLTADASAACGTAAIFVLYSCSALRLWQLYLINALLSLMNAFQAPAAFVAASMLAPKEQYTRISGLQGFSGAAVSILAPALGGVLLTVGGMSLVLTCDLLSFGVAFTVLLCFIRIPEPDRSSEPSGESVLRSCLYGVRYLRAHPILLRLTLFFAAVNFLAKLGNDGMLAPFVLGKTAGDQQILGLVQSSVALGLLAGSLFVTLRKPAANKLRVICLTCAVVFLGNVLQSLCERPLIWCAAAFGAYLTAAVMNANLTAFLREQVPAELQGRVFSAKDTLQNGTIPPALWLGGILADRVFEPWMASDASAPPLLARCFGTGSGAGVAVMFFCVGILGVLLCLFQLRRTKRWRPDKQLHSV